MCSFVLVAEHSKCYIQKCQVDVMMFHVSRCRSHWYDQLCKRCVACRDTDIFSECFMATGKSNGRVKAAVTLLLLVMGPYAVPFVNHKSNSLNLIDLICRASLGLGVQSQ